MRTCSCCTFLFSPSWRFCSTERPVSLPISRMSLKGKVHKYTYTHAYIHTCIHMCIHVTFLVHLFSFLLSWKVFPTQGFPWPALLETLLMTTEWAVCLDAWMQVSWSSCSNPQLSSDLLMLDFMAHLGCLKQPGSADHLVLGSCEASPELALLQPATSPLSQGCQTVLNKQKVLWARAEQGSRRLETLALLQQWEMESKGKCLALPMETAALSILCPAYVLVEEQNSFLPSGLRIISSICKWMEYCSAEISARDSSIFVFFGPSVLWISCVYRALRYINHSFCQCSSAIH